jgi:hypothetical protein
MGRLPEAWLAPPAVRELRELVRYRAKLVALRSGLKAQVHAVLAKEGVRVPMSDLFGVAGGRLLDELQLGRAYGMRVASLRSLIGAYDQEITMLGREISTALAGDVGYLAIQAIPRSGFGAGSRPRGRDRRHPPLRRRSPAVLLGRAHPSSPRVRHHRAPRPDHQTGPPAGPLGCRRGPPSGCLEAASRPPTSTASPTGAAPASAGSRPPASCSPWSTTACATARCAAWPRRLRRRDERLGRSPARARVCHDPRLAAWSPI